MNPASADAAYLIQTATAMVPSIAKTPVQTTPISSLKGSADVVYQMMIPTRRDG